MQERFRTINLLDGEPIEVGDQGTIIYTNKKGEQVETKGSEVNGGYLKIQVGKHHYSVNRLVAKAFIDNKLNLSGKRTLGCNNIDVCHKDGNRQNNALYNLSIKTHKDNCNEPRSRFNYMKSNSQLKCGYKNIQCTDKENNHHTFTDWDEVAEFLNKPKHNCRSNILLSIHSKGTAYGCKWSRDREEWYPGKNTKYYTRIKDGVRPYIDKVD